MAAFYATFTSTRTTSPDPAALLVSMRAALDISAGVAHLPGGEYLVKKATDWTAQQQVSAQSAIDTCPAATPATVAQAQIDGISVFEKAVILTLLDQINVLRAALPTPLAPITPAQAIAAVRAKAATL
jgi:hypothetical protein